ncbi:MAG: hypothetical protein A2X99_05310 [Deltaproteobacteria bacterium GWB2_55_19]|nr:MAG: hypothetical protein A2X99_05310 [Deltaproteobacteria bacterium GWB2_55_19]
MVDTIIFVHGWATDSAIWGKTVAALNSARVVNLNLPGHGGRLKWYEPSLRPAIDEIALYTSGLSDGSIIGVGWSLGAQALLSMAAIEKKKFKALVLVGATPCFLEKDDFPWGQPRALVKKMLIDMKKDASSTLERFHPLNFTEEEAKTEAAEEFIKRYRFPGPVDCAGEVPGCFPAFDYAGITTALESLYNTDLREILKEISVPVLLIHGGKDVVTPIGASRFLESRMKVASLTVFEDSGHAPFITEPERFNRAFKGFLAIL